VGVTAFTPKSIKVQFGGHGIQIQCNSAGLYNLLAFYFNHCLNRHSPVSAATYKVIEIQNDLVQLFRNGELIVAGVPVQQIALFLTQDVFTQLISPCFDHLLFHAAGLVLGSQGIIICGASGSGKSTFVAQMAALGYDYLTDELIGFSVQDQNIRGISRVIVLKRGAIPVLKIHFRQGQTKGWYSLPDGSIWLDPQRLFPCRFRKKAKPRLLLFLQYSAEAVFSTVQLSPADAAFSLMQHLVNARNLPDFGLKATAQLADTVHAYRLIYSDLVPVRQWLKTTLGH
jgi:hypothetical protein